MSHRKQCSGLGASRVVSGLVLSLGLVVLGGCDVNDEARVTIVYDQVANFATYNFGDGGSTGASPNIFVMYRLVSISNEESEASDFTFERDFISTVTSTHTVSDGPLAGTQSILLSGQSIDTQFIPVDSSSGGGLGCFIVYARSDDPSELNGTSSLIDLIYASTTEQPVSTLRAAGDNTTAIFLSGPATPASLQQLCATGSSAS